MKHSKKKKKKKKKLDSARFNRNSVVQKHNHNSLLVTIRLPVSENMQTYTFYKNLFCKNVEASIKSVLYRHLSL